MRDCTVLYSQIFLPSGAFVTSCDWWFFHWEKLGHIFNPSSCHTLVIFKIRPLVTHKDTEHVLIFYWAAVWQICCKDEIIRTWTIRASKENCTSSLPLKHNFQPQNKWLWFRVLTETTITQNFFRKYISVFKRSRISRFGAFEIEFSKFFPLKDHIKKGLLRYNFFLKRDILRVSVPELDNFPWYLIRIAMKPNSWRIITPVTRWD